MTRLSPRQTGFTLVELVVVIILLGILSVYAAPRFLGVSDFSPYAAQEQAITIIRQIQLGSMQYNDSPAPTQYQLSVSGDCLGSVAACSLSDPDERAKRSDSLLISDNASLSFSPDLTINFDLLGNPDLGDTTITISGGEDSLYVCINSQGYVSRGVCP
jgi:MSHA pilin protein MshC